MPRSLSRPRDYRFRPLLERLEDRTVLSTDISRSRVFHDLNANGLRDAGEPVIPGRIVYLDTNANNLRDAGEVFSVTDPNGYYKFANLNAGSYRIALEGTANWMQTGPAPTPGPGLRGEVLNSFVHPNEQNHGQWIGLAWGNGQLFVSARREAIHRIDPINGSILQTIQLPAGVDNIGMVFDGTALWYADIAASKLNRIDLNGNPLNSINISSGVGPAFPTWDGTNLYVATNINTVEVRNPINGNVVRTLNIPFVNPRGMAYVNGRLWIGYDDGKLYEVDAITGQVYGSVDPPTGTSSGLRPFALTFDGQYLWLNQFPGGPSEVSIIRMDISAPTPRLITLQDGDFVTNLNFGSFQLGAVSGQIFNDLNGSGTQNSGENGLVGWRMYDDVNNNGIYDSWEGYADSDNNGSYVLTGLKPGNHVIRAHGRPGWQMTTSSNQTITINASGQVTSSNSIGAQHIRTGLLGAETVVNSTQSDLQKFGDHLWYGDPQRSVAIDSTGAFVIVWEGNGFGDADGIFMQRFDANSNRLGGETRVNVATSGNQMNPRVARAWNTGQYAVAWHDGSAIKVRLFDSNGNALSGEIVVTSNNQIRSLAMDADGDFAVQYFNGTSTDIYVRRYNSLGQPQGAVINVVRTNWYNGFTQMAMDASGNFIVAYSDTRISTTVKRFDNQGHAVGQHAIFYDEEARMPNVAMNVSGQYVVTAEILLQGGLMTIANVFNSDGSIRSSAELPAAQSHSLGIEPNGDYVLATDSNEIQLHRYTADGVLKEAPFRVNTRTAFTQVFPSVAVISNGEYVVAWTNGATGDGYSPADPITDIRFQRVSTPVSLQPQSVGGKAQFTPRISSPPSNLATFQGILAWTRQTLNRADSQVVNNPKRGDQFTVHRNPTASPAHRFMTLIENNQKSRLPGQSKQSQFRPTDQFLVSISSRQPEWTQFRTTDLAFMELRLLTPKP